MNFVEKLANNVFELMMLIQSLGKNNEYTYKINDSLFYIRKNTSDLFTINELWKHKIYNIRIMIQDNIVDLGANIGSFSIFAAKKAINGKVFAFEPENSNYLQLVKNINLNKLTNTFAYKVGIADKKGSIPLFLSNKNKGAASIHESHTKKIEKINCIPLRNIFKLCHISKIDVLKIDVEGAEYNLLFSTPKYVFKRINSIVVEFHDFLGLKHYYKDLIALLEKNSFKVCLHSPRIYFNQKLYYVLFKKGILIAVK